MPQKSKTTTAIVALITFALVGMVWVQIVLLAKAFELARQAHAQNVNAALSGIVEKLEDRETVAQVFSAIIKPDSGQRKLTVQTSLDEFEDRLAHGDSLIVIGGLAEKRIHYPFDFDPHKRQFKFTLAIPQRVRLRVVDSLGQEVNRIVDEIKPAGTFEVALDSVAAAQPGQFYNLRLGADSAKHEVIILTADLKPGTAEWVGESRRARLVDQVLDELAFVERQPIAERIQVAALDSLVRTELADRGLDTPVAYGVIDYSANRDTVQFVTPANFQEALKKSPLRARLFPGEPFAPRSDLILYFPQQNLYLLKKTGGLFLSVLALLGVIVFCFVHTLRTLFRQKQFAQLLTQFINNMTHEFKTPISTIALASEAFRNPAVLHDREKVRRYGAIILDESQRMRSQVEKILQMAVLEEGDYELNFSRFDIHELLAEALQNFAVQIEKRGGEIIRQFRATKTAIAADLVHVANIINNLLDNANKYTRTAPRIVVGTTSDEQGVHVSIADNGIGLRPEEQKHVFDKYYRVPTGNVHDVKGFGLGLSYVKLMAEAHGGSITVASEYQKGSVFHLFLPFAPAESAHGELKQAE